MAAMVMAMAMAMSIAKEGRGQPFFVDSSPTDASSPGKER